MASKGILSKYAKFSKFICFLQTIRPVFFSWTSCIVFFIFFLQRGEKKRKGKPRSLTENGFISRISFNKRYILHILLFPLLIHIYLINMIINFVLNNINHIAQIFFVSSLNNPRSIYSVLCLCLCLKIICLCYIIRPYSCCMRECNTETIKDISFRC